MTELDQRLLAARQLGDHGLCRSAIRLLDATEAIGRAVNSLRARLRTLAREPRIAPGIYALGTLPDVAVVLPLAVGPGDASCAMLDADSQTACRIASDVVFGHVAARFGAVPRFSITIPDRLGTSGRSLGLAAALALAKRIGGLRLARPIIATGELDPAGSVLPVAGLEAKIDAARAELDGTSGLVLVPAGDARHAGEGDGVRGVKTFAEALRIVWELDSLPIDGQLLAVEQLVAASRAEPDHRTAIGILSSRPIDDLAPPDRARLFVEMGTRLRHTGDAIRAAELHDRVEVLLPEIARVEGRAAVESMRVELIATRVSLFLLDEAERKLRTMLAGDFELQHNRVRCQGMLAQLLSTTGRHEEALRLRVSNLELQRQTDAMRREIPRTLASLVWEAARAERDDLFDEHLPRLLDETPPQDGAQQRYTDSAVVRGLVRLGRYRLVVDWIDGVTDLRGRRPSRQLAELVTGTGPISRHPEVSTARCLVRAFGETGQTPRALELADRVRVVSGEPLLSWLGGLCSLERLLVRTAAMSPIEFVAECARNTDDLERVCGFAPQMPAVTSEGFDSTEWGPKLMRWLDDVYY